MFSSLFGKDDEDTAVDDQSKEKESPSSEKGSTKDVWGSFMNVALSVKNVVTEKVKEGAESAANIALGDFQSLQKEFIDSRKNSAGSSLPPWIGCDNEEELKAQILALSKDRRNFIRDPPVGQNAFVFDFQRSAASAMATLDEDPMLKKMRHELVPKVMSEERFWQNYFYRVSLIKQSSEVSAMVSEPLVSKSTPADESLEHDDADAPLPTRAPQDDVDDNSFNDMRDSSLLEDMEDEEELTTLEAPTTQESVSLADLDGSDEDKRTDEDKHTQDHVSASALADLEKTHRLTDGITTPEHQNTPTVGDVTPSDGTADTLASANWEKDLEAELEGFDDYEEGPQDDTEDLGAGWEDEVAQMLKDEEDSNEANGE